MKIFIFQNAPAPFRTPLFRKLQEKFEITVVYGIKSSGDRYGNPVVVGYSHHFLKGVDIKIKGKTLTYARGLGEYLKEHDFDVYIINDDWRCLMSTLTIVRSVRKRRKPVILWCGGIDTPYRRKVMIPKTFMALYNFYMKHITKDVRAFLAYGPKTVDYFCRQYNIPEEKFTWGTQAAEPEPSHPVAGKAEIPAAVIFLFIGYLEQRKGIQDLIRAINQIQRHDYKLVIAGKGKDEAQFQEIAKDNPRIEFIGYVEGLRKRHCFLEADVMVSPTYHDPWANTINEACVYGLPIITTPAEGAEGTLAIDRFNACVVPPGDIERLRAALEYCLANKSSLLSMGKNSRSLAEKFNLAWAAENFSKAVRIALRS